MSGQLIPPPELAATLPSDITPQQSIEAWIDLMKAADKLVIAGLRREIGPDGDIRAAYQKWYRAQRADHDLAVQRTLQWLKQHGGWDGHRSGS